MSGRGRGKVNSKKKASTDTSPSKRTTRSQKADELTKSKKTSTESKKSTAKSSTETIVPSKKAKTTSHLTSLSSPKSDRAIVSSPPSKGSKLAAVTPEKETVTPIYTVFDGQEYRTFFTKASAISFPSKTV